MYEQTSRLIWVQTVLEKKLFFDVMDKSNFTPNLMATELHFLALIDCIDTKNNLFFFRVDPSITIRQF